MKLDTFSLIVNKGREVVGGYVEMRHGTEYSLSMGNDRFTDCDAVVRIDGVEVGTWRITPHHSLLIERPANIDRKFTFYKFGTAESVQAGLERNDNLGLISVDFIPAREVNFSEACYGAVSKAVTRGYNAGGTGLGDRSNQSFGQAECIDRDYSKQVTINLRLVCVDEPAIVSLRGISNPVPPSVF